MTAKIDISSIPQELFVTNILPYVPEDMNGINRAMQRAVNEFFDCLHKDYTKNDLIRRFMPPPSIAKTMSKRAIVLQTAADIFECDFSMHEVDVSKNLSCDHLLSILERIEHYLQRLPSRAGFCRPLITYGIDSSHLPTVRIALACGITPCIRGDAVFQATIKRNLPIVQMLLAHGQISEFTRLSSLTVAIDTGQLGMVRALSPQRNASGSQIVRAIVRGHLPIARFLLNNNSALFRQCSVAVIAALVLQVFLKNLLKN